MTNGEGTVKRTRQVSGNNGRQPLTTERELENEERQKRIKNEEINAAHGVREEFYNQSTISFNY